MINNWDEHNLKMDFSSYTTGNDHPSDIDMFYLCRDDTLIIGEIKNERGHFGEGQRHMMTRLIEDHKGDAIGLFITHDKYIQRGDTVVDVMRCPVREIYVKNEHRWRLPKHQTTVKEILDYYKRRKK